MVRIICPFFNPLPNDKILDVTKLKAFADDKLKVGRMMIVLLEEWKTPAFSPFPTVFSKAFFFRVVKSRDCVVKS